MNLMIKEDLQELRKKAKVAGGACGMPENIKDCYLDIADAVEEILEDLE